MPRRESQSTRSQVPAFYLASVCSGAAALIYQIVWSKTLSLSFGSTTQGAAAVIAGFMIGMGAGARIFGARDFGGNNPGRVYAYLELAIALIALILSPLLYHLPTFSSDATMSAILARYGMALGVLFVPSALLGATFPALCRAVISTNGELRDRLGAVYGFNTLGAALGALVTGFIFVELLGGYGAVWCAVALNVSAAVLALSAAGKARAETLGTAKLSKSMSAAVDLPGWALLTVAGLSGFAILAFEIVCFRAAKYLIGNSTYGMSIVLAVFLCGLGLGGLLERRIARRAKLTGDLITVQLGIALAILTAAALLYAATNWPPLRDQLSIFSQAMTLREWPIRLAWSLVATVVILLPPTLLMGLSFPIIITLVTRTVERLGHGIGVVYLSSSVGSMLGAIIAAAVLLPMLGTMGGFKIAAGIAIALAVLLNFLARRETKRSITGVIAALACAVALLAVLPSRMEFQGELEGGTSRVIFAKEGDLATVKVTLAENGIWKGMTIDGYAIGIDRSLPRDITFKQLLLAHMPLVLHPEAKSVLNIGLGSASTQASLASYTNWERMDCVEISREVVEGARFFDDGQTLDDPRLRLHVADAMHFLRGGDETFDVIVADGKQNPQFPGNAALLSRELFESARARLAPGGIMVQWIPLGFPPRAFDVMARTFAEVFAEMSVYYYPPEALILVGGQSAPSTAFSQPQSARFAEDLSPYLIVSPEQLVAGWVADGKGLRTVLSGAGLNTWDHPVLEFWPYRDFDPRRAMADKGRNLDVLERAGGQSRSIAFGDAVSAHAQTSALVRRGFKSLYMTGSPAEFANRLDSAIVSHPNDPMALGLRERLRQGPTALLHSGPL